MAAPTIRDTRPGDFASILALNAESVHFLSPLTEDRLRHLHDRAAYHRVVERDGGVAAFLLALREGADYDSPNYAWFSRRYDGFLYIDRVVVDARERRRGLGRLLYSDVIAFAARTGCPIVACEFDVEPPNAASQRFHEEHAFAEVGTQTLHGGAKVVSLRVRRSG